LKKVIIFLGTENKRIVVLMKKAFTLAEVLLTLAIIGVVAALTIPSVIISTTQSQYVVSLKKAFNTLKAVEREAKQEHGEMQYWGWQNSLDDFNTYFKPYFDVLKDCGTDTDDGCFAKSYKQVGGGASTFMATPSDYAKIITPDGMAYAFQAANVGIVRGYFYVDVNSKKLPNVFGRDVFAFLVTNVVGIKPAGSIDTDGDSIKTSDVDTDCLDTGTYCAVKVLGEGAMNY